YGVDDSSSFLRHLHLISGSTFLLLCLFTYLLFLSPTLGGLFLFLFLGVAAPIFLLNSRSHKISEFLAQLIRETAQRVFIVSRNLMGIRLGNLSSVFKSEIDNQVYLTKQYHFKAQILNGLTTC